MEKFTDAVGSRTKEIESVSPAGSEIGPVRHIAGESEVKTIRQICLELDLVVSRLKFLRAQLMTVNAKYPRQQGLGDFLDMTISHLAQVIKKDRQPTRGGA